jgi:hypothetical protein
MCGTDQMIEKYIGEITASLTTCCCTVQGRMTVQEVLRALYVGGGR